MRLERTARRPQGGAGAPPTGTRFFPVDPRSLGGIPTRMPAAAIQSMTRRGATFDPRAELRKLTASLATPTTMRIGFIFQEYNILDEFTVEANVALALELQGKAKDREKIQEILRAVELENFAKRKPNTLSGGQKQRGRFEGIPPLS